MVRGTGADAEHRAAGLGPGTAAAEVTRTWTEPARSPTRIPPEGAESFQWALIRVVPRVERGEAINAAEQIVYSKRLPACRADHFDEAAARAEPRPSTSPPSAARHRVRAGSH